MTALGEGIIVGVLGQWASGKTEATKALVGHLGGEGGVAFLADRVLFARQAINYILELEDSEVAVAIEDDGSQRLDGELATVWLGPGEDLRTVNLNSLLFRVHDDDVLYAWRNRAKVELGHEIRERAAHGKPVVIEAAFGPDMEPGNPLGRSISALFARLEKAGVEPRQVRWIIVEAGFEKRAERNEKRAGNLPPRYFEKYGAEGGDLEPDHQRMLEEQGVRIKRVSNNHDDVERLRSDVIAAFEDMS